MKIGDLVWVVPCDGSKRLFGNDNPKRNTMRRITNIDGYSVSIDGKSLCWYKKNFQPVCVGDICEVRAQQGDDSVGFIQNCPVRMKVRITKIDADASYYPLYVASPAGNMGCQVGSLHLIKPVEPEPTLMGHHHIPTTPVYNSKDGTVHYPVEPAPPDYCCFSCAKQGEPFKCPAYNSCATQKAIDDKYIEDCNPYEREAIQLSCKEKLKDCWQRKESGEGTTLNSSNDEERRDAVPKPEVSTEEQAARQKREARCMACKQVIPDGFKSSFLSCKIRLCPTCSEIGDWKPTGHGSPKEFILYLRNFKSHLAALPEYKPRYKDISRNGRRQRVDKYTAPWLRREWGR